MEENIFKDAKFGDKFLTRDGRTVLFDKNTLRKELITYCYHQDLGLMAYNYQNGKCIEFTEGDCDIVSRYKEPIDEEKLDELAEDSADDYVDDMCDKNKSFNVEDTYIEGFKAGYRNQRRNKI